MSSKGTIPLEVKIEVVRQLACYETISAVAAHIKKEHGVALSPQAIEAHDPTKHAGRKLASKWRELFETTRQRFIDEAAQIPIAHRSYRLSALHRMSVKAEERGNFPLAAQLLEQAAKEVGNAFTNRRELSAPSGGFMLPSEPTYRLVGAGQRPVAIFALPDNTRDPKLGDTIIQGKTK